MACGVLLGSSSSVRDLYGSSFSISPSFWNHALGVEQPIASDDQMPHNAPRKSWLDEWAMQYESDTDLSKHKKQRLLVSTTLQSVACSNSPCLVISATPGTGKTSAIMSILKSVVETADAHDSPCKCLVLAHSNQAVENTLEKLAVVAGLDYCQNHAVMIRSARRTLGQQNNFFQLRVGDQSVPIRTFTLRPDCQENLLEVLKDNSLHFVFVTAALLHL